MVKIYKTIFAACISLLLLFSSSLFLFSCKAKSAVANQPEVATNSGAAPNTTVAQELKAPVAMPQKPAIVFCSDRTGNYELYYMSIDGSNVVQATSDANVDYYPRFSPDGSKVVFASTRDIAYPEIYLMNADGTSVKRLTKNEVSDDDPCFSPDGLRVFFTSLEAQTQDQTQEQSGPPISSIYSIGIDGFDQVKIKDDPDGNYSDYDPIVSPDGLKLLFSSSRTYDDEIYVMDIEGLQPVNLTNAQGWDGRPNFSPDGSKIVFSSGREGDGETADIYIMNSDGTDVKNLTDSGAFNTDPCFSPDGSKIVFGSKKDDAVDIFIMDADGKNAVQLTKDAGLNYYPRFSPE